MFTQPSSEKGFSVAAIQEYYQLGGSIPTLRHARRPECRNCHQVPLQRGFVNSIFGLECNRCRFHLTTRLSLEVVARRKKQIQPAPSYAKPEHTCLDCKKVVSYSYVKRCRKCAAKERERMKIK